MANAFWEKYKDPRWQRRRLEIMNKAGFRCQECEATEKTLNVHHKLYRKGANPWEYEDYELVCLCEDCHTQHHDHKTAIQDILGRCETYELPSLHALIVGYQGGMVASEGVPEKWATDTIFPGDQNSHAYWSGRFARALVDVSKECVQELEALFNALNPDGFEEFIKNALGQIKTERPD